MKMLTGLSFCRSFFSPKTKVEAQENVKEPRYVEMF